MHSRRSFLATLTAAPLTASLQSGSRPNILFIAIDDLNDWIGCLGGHAGVKTPNLDKLASEGVLFRSAHCAAPLCNPSRVAIMTGRRPSSTGIYENSQPYTGSKVLKSATTLNQCFKDNGYLTLGCGKIYHGVQGAFADRQGWDEYGKPTADAVPRGMKAVAGAAAQAHFDWGPTAGGDEEMHDFQTAEWIGKRLSTKHSQPFFIACGIAKPHLPWYVPQKYFDLYPLDKIELPIVKEDDLNDVPELGKRMAKPEGDHARVTRAEAWKKGVQAYLAAISFSDAMVGKVLQALESGPNAANTAVVLWSDHGWHLGEKSHWRKFTLWERSTRNVLMAKIPGMTKPGGLCDRPVSLLDLYPTLTELAGLKPPAVLEGQSLVKWLKQPATAKAEPAITTYGFGNHAVRTEAWRYIQYRDGSEELYDRVKDPNEWTNLAADPKNAATKAVLKRWLPAHNEPDAPNAKGED